MERCSLVLLLLAMRRRISLEGSVAQVGRRRRRRRMRRRLLLTRRRSKRRCCHRCYCRYEPPSVPTATQSPEIRTYPPTLPSSIVQMWTPGENEQKGLFSRVVVILMPGGFFLFTFATFQRFLSAQSVEFETEERLYLPGNFNISVSISNHT